MTSATALLGLEPQTVGTRHGSQRVFAGGDGPPVVLVHGLSVGAAAWADVARALVARHRVVVPDLPGHGGSDPPSPGATLDVYADAVADAIEALGAAPALVAGHSFGAQIAGRLAERRPAAVRGLLLIGPSGVTRLGPLTGALALLGTLLRPGAAIAPLGGRLAGRAWFRRAVFRPLLVADPVGLSGRAVAGFFAEMREHRDVRTARRALVADTGLGEQGPFACPAIVLWGADDAIVPVAHGVLLARRTGAPLRVIADCGHVPIGERPAAVVDAIAALDGAATRRS